MKRHVVLGVLILVAFLGVNLSFSIYAFEYQAIQLDPGNLTNFVNAKPGDTILFKVTGRTSGGSAWGTDLYTTDSALALVVVHAGVLKVGEEGVVKVTFVPGQDNYEGTSRNGVSTSSWGSYELSYRVEHVNW